MNKLSLVTSDATSDTSRHISFCLCCWHCITSSFKCDTFSNNVAHLCFNWITSNLHLKILLNNIKTKTVVKQMLKLSTGSKVCWEGRVTLPYHFSCPQYRQNSAPTREADLSSRPLHYSIVTRPNLKLNPKLLSCSTHLQYSSSDHSLSTLQAVE